MKNIIILNVLLLSLFVSTKGLAQTYEVEWDYQLYNESVTHIAKTGEKIVNNDTLSVYQFITNNIPSDTVFLLKEGGDTTFILFRDSLYFLYTINTQVGDIWHPLMFTSVSVEDPSTDTCRSFTFEVEAIDTVLMGGNQLKRIGLSYHENNLNVGVSVIDKIGIWWYGMLYHYYVNSCMGPIVDKPFPCLIKYHSDELNYTYTRMTSCFADIQENSPENEPQILRKENRIEVTWNEKDVDLELYNISGQKIRSVQQHTLYLPQEQGIYFLHIQQNTDSRVVKLAN